MLKDIKPLIELISLSGIYISEDLILKVLNKANEV
ncbi:MAG: hypothetical protein KDK36_21215 [Leptospiraceae bacterium]|nr:hypothetical protein [Leptospiraceae bacterium]